MFEPNFEQKITFEIPNHLDLERLSMNNNFTVLLTEFSNIPGSSGGSSDFSDVNLNSKHNYMESYHHVLSGDDYDKYMGDIWLGILLMLMIGCSIFCMCTCFLYNKYRQWKMNGELFLLIFFFYLSINNLMNVYLVLFAIY